MSGCRFTLRIAAYHDGELDAPASKEIELHLPGCEQCQSELAGLKEVSSAMAGFEPGEISQIELARLHRAIDRVDDRSQVRLGVGLIGLAASVLIISLAWIGQGPTRPVHQANAGSRPRPAWESLALGGTPQRPYIEDQDRALRLPPTGVAQGPERDTIEWMLNGLEPVANASR